MISFRRWQREAIRAALKKFATQFSHFLCLATPGAGKTVMASAIADILMKEDKVDLVLCFSPSTVVANDFKVELEAITKKRFCGGLGASGSSLTYQSMMHLDETFWSLLNTYRVFVIFDEIHHCAGDGIENANAWGEQILKNIQGKAHYTIALTGTPWRSDTIPIALANYVGEDNQLQLDYRYGLVEAIEDGVCRCPQITLFDNELISVMEGLKRRSFTSISDFLLESGMSYHELISHDEVIRQILSHGISLLNRERQTFRDAGGLIVAASITHAKQIQQLLRDLGESSDLVTYHEKDPENLIRHFKESCKKWIISISMISEGTNIPRLRICCYLSLVTTELYFRQVLGRVLRAQNSSRETGFLIVPAHPRLLEFSARVAEEIPHHAVIRSPGKTEGGVSEASRTSLEQKTSLISSGIEEPSAAISVVGKEEFSHGLLTSWYDSRIDSFGRFQHKVFTL